jgi:4-amino-4-deoxy-L-arabinose transferase-like glycosyltransferase
MSHLPEQHTGFRADARAGPRRDGTDAAAATDAATRSTWRALMTGPPLWACVIWLVLVLGGLAARPPLVAVDGQLLSDAWWSWQDAPGAAGSGPDLLFWLIHASWSLFGVSELLARLVGPLFVLASLFLALAAARQLWPAQPDAARFAPLIVIGTGGIVAFASQTLTDTPMIAMTFLSVLGLASFRNGMQWRGSILFALAIAGGLLLKGPLALVWLLPAMIVLPLLARDTPTGILSFMWLAAAAIAALAGWAGYVAAANGWDAVAIAFTFEPDPGRRAWYWLPALALLLAYPWIWWRSTWRAMARLKRGGFDRGTILVIAAVGGALLGALLDPYRGPHVLLPALALAALIAAHALGSTPEKARDFHAALPGIPLLFIGFVFFLLNIVPHAHLDAVWRRVFGESSLPIWLGGISLGAGLLLLGGGYLLAQLTPRPLAHRILQVALLPVLMASALNIEFIGGLRTFFDLEPLAEKIHDFQAAGQPIAIYGSYDGGFDLAGRLSEPPIVLPDANSAHRWAAANRSGIVVAYFAGSTLRLPAQPLELAAAGDRWAALWPAETIIATEGQVLQQRF